MEYQNTEDEFRTAEFVLCVCQGGDAVDIRGHIDHSVLKPSATQEEIAEGARLCRLYGFAAYCVNSRNVARAREFLKGTAVRIASTVAFPFGTMTTRTKVFETIEAVSAGADEIDMVADIGGLREGELSRVTEDIRAVVDAAQGRTVKVIIETGFLSREAMLWAVEAIVGGGAHYLKNSTGFGPKGAEVEEMTWLRAVTPKFIHLKAAGGIRTYDQAMQFLAIGVERIGTSAGPGLLGTGIQKEASVQKEGKDHDP